MTHFYRFLLYFARFDVALGVATGRDPDVIEADRDAVRQWEHALLMEQIGGMR